MSCHIYMPGWDSETEVSLLSYYTEEHSLRTDTDKQIFLLSMSIIEPPFCYKWLSIRKRKFQLRETCALWVMMSKCFRHSKRAMKDEELFSSLYFLQLWIPTSTLQSHAARSVASVGESNPLSTVSTSCLLLLCLVNNYRKLGRVTLSKLDGF